MASSTLPTAFLRDNPDTGLRPCPLAPRDSTAGGVVESLQPEASETCLVQGPASPTAGRLVGVGAPFPEAEVRHHVLIQLRVTQRGGC